MSKFRKAICYTFALLLALQSIFVLSPELTKAQVTPTPEQPCYEIHEGGLIKVKCVINNKNIVFSPDGDCGTEASGYQYLLYSATVGGKKFYALVQYGTKKLQKIALSINSTQYNTGLSSEDGADYWKCSPLVNGDPTSSILAPTTAYYWVHTDAHGWSAFAPFITSDNSAYDIIKSIITKTASDQFIGITPYSRTAPTPENLASCGTDKLTLPITAISGGPQKFSEDIKNGWLKNLNDIPDTEANRADKAKAIQVVNDTLSDINAIYPSSRDIQLFKKFYDPTYQNGDRYPPKYPTVIIGKTTQDAVYKEYSDIAALISSLAASSNTDMRNYILIVGPLMKAGGISMYELDALPLWALSAAGGPAGIIAGYQADKMIQHWANMTVDDAKALVRKQLELYFSHLYIKNNLTFNKCLASKEPPDPFAYDTAPNLESLIQQVDSILDSSFGDLNSFASGEDGKTVCDGLKGTYIVVMLKQAFCGLMIITKEWADTAYNYSISLLASSIGVATDDNARIDEMEKAEGVRVGPYKAGDDPAAGSGDPAGGTGDPAGSNFSISSGSFSNGANIPVANTFLGSNKNPSVNFSNKPSGTKSFALKFVDETNSNEVRWNVFNIPASVNRIESTVGGPTAYDGIMYSGPNPSDSRRHKYVLTVYALNQETLSSYNSITNTMILAHASIIGYYQKPSETPLP